MDLTFYTNTSANNVIGKVLDVGEVITVFLKRDFDIGRPTLLLHGVDIAPYNYFYLAGGINRFYFIDDSRILAGGVVQISATCDYLETYKTEILDSYAKHRTVIGVNTFGDVEVNLTGDYSENRYSSSVELTEVDNSILSVLGY